MDIESVIGELRNVVEGQLRIAGSDPAVAAAGEAVLAALEPAMHRVAFDLAEQAAAEVSAQLPTSSVDVVLSDGQPMLVVRPSTEAVKISTEYCDARMTVRLPEDLKGDLEAAAFEFGDSVNAFVVRALSGSADAFRKSSRSTFEGTVET